MKSDNVQQLYFSSTAKFAMFYKKNQIFLKSVTNLMNNSQGIWHSRYCKQERKRQASGKLKVLARLDPEWNPPQVQAWTQQSISGEK